MNRIFIIISVSFNIYDVNSDGTISATELRDTILALMQEQNIVMTSAEAETIVSQTIAEIVPDNRDFITFEQ